MPKVAREKDGIGGAQHKKKNTISNLSATITIFVCLAIFVYIYLSGMLTLPIKIIAAIIDLVVCGEIVSMAKASERLFYGIYMIRSQYGLRLMDKVAGDNRWFWNGLSDWGLVLGFGLLSYFIFRRNISKRMLVFGVASILFMLFFILPFIALPFSFVNLPQITSAIQSSGASAQNSSINYFSYALYALSAIGGFAIYVIFSIAYNAALILYAILIAITSSLTSTPNYGPLNSSIPGIAPIIPGITIPLFAGILAFVLILSVHEFSHGVLSRIAGVRIKSSGTLMFGAIPIGGFVEIDEKQAGKLNKKLQNRISSAGISANMLLAVITFAFMYVLFFYVMPNFTTSYVYVQSTLQNTSAYNVIAPNSIILKWNGYNISTLSDFQKAAKNDVPYSSVSIMTNNGSYLLKTNSNGKVGVYVNQSTHLGGGALGSIVFFLYMFFGLSFLLNFLVAVVNLLPIPGFDGSRIFITNIKSKKRVRYIIMFVLIMIFINILPWFWSL